MKKLILLAALFTPFVNADVDATNLKESVKILCDNHQLKPQCEILATSMLTHAYVTGQTQTACELGIINACKVKIRSNNFNANVQMFESYLQSVPAP